MRESARTALARARAGRKLIAPGGSLFAGFLAFYLIMSHGWAATPAFQENNILFENDTPRVIDDISNHSAIHHRTNVHPLYVLMLNPVGSLVKSIVRSDVLAAALVNSFLGALATCLAFAFFLLLGGGYPVSLLLAGLFGFSMSQIFNSTVPHTGSLSSCSLLVTYILFLASLQGKRVSLAAWVAAGVAAFGATSSNFIQTLICFSLSALVAPRDRRESAWAGIAKFLVAVALVAIALALVQRSLYGTRLFWQIGGYRWEYQYASLFILEHPLYVIATLAKHIFLVNVIGPLPNLFAMPGRGGVSSAVTFIGALRYTAVGWLAAGLWIVALAGGSVRGFLAPGRRRAFYAGIALCLLFNVALHSVYGVRESGRIEYFCYTGNFTFLTITLLGGLFAAGALRDRLRVALAVLVTLAACNNILVMGRILSIYR